MKEALLVDIENITFQENPDTEINNLIGLIKQFEVQEIEPELEEEIECITAGKYYFLSVLRNVFIEFKRLGDTQLKVSKGTCGQECYGKLNKVYQFEGNVSKETFAFVVEENTKGIKGLHFCVGFVDENGKKGDNYYNFMLMAAIKLSEMKKDKSK